MPRLEYLACIFCGKSQLLDAPDHPPFSGEIEPLKYRVLQRREARGGPGRGNHVKGVGGFFVIKEECETIVEMQESHPDLVEDIKERLLQIVGEYLRAGIIEASELPVPRKRKP